MARKRTDIRISLHGISGDTVRLNLSLDVFGEQWHVYRDGVLSKSFPRASSTLIAKQIQRWLIGQAKATSESRRRQAPVVGVRIPKPLPVSC